MHASHQQKMAAAERDGEQLRQAVGELEQQLQRQEQQRQLQQQQGAPRHIVSAARRGNIAGIPKGWVAALPALSLPSKAERSAVFQRMNMGGDGALSVAEIQEALFELYPGYSYKLVRHPLSYSHDSSFRS
eukprot:COSAG05_NODE_3817_length_1822_cov_1.278003_3_plen_131_part_00